MNSPTGSYNCSIREYVKLPDIKENSLVIHKEVGLHTDVSPILKTVNGTKGVLLEKIKDYEVPIVSGFCGNRSELARYWHISPSQLRNTIADKLEKPVPWQIAVQGKCQECSLEPPDDLMDIFPIPTFSACDSAPFITAGNVMLWDEQAGKILSSIRRLQVNKDGTLNILIESPGLLNRFLKAEKEGQDVDVAVVLGVHPLLILASQLNSQVFSQDKLSFAGSLLGYPVSVVKCQTVNCYVPADAEIVIEGKILAGQRHPEGPFGELAGYYGPVSQQPVIQITRITHRHQPWLQVISPGSYEHMLPGALLREVVLYRTLKQIVPEVEDVHITMAGCGRFHAIISLHNPVPGMGKTALMAAFASNKDLKHVIAVNDDIDIFDHHDVEWAIATRVQADTDVVIVPGVQGSSLEPSHTLRNISAKMGIDATYPSEMAQKFSRVNPAGNWPFSLDMYV